METVTTRQSSITLRERTVLAREIGVAILVGLVLWLIAAPIASWILSINPPIILLIAIFGMIFMAVSSAGGGVANLMRRRRLLAAIKKELNRRGYKNITFNPKGYFTAANYHGTFVRGVLARVDDGGIWAVEKTFAIIEF